MKLGIGYLIIIMPRGMRIPAGAPAITAAARPAASNDEYL